MCKYIYIVQLPCCLTLWSNSYFIILHLSTRSEIESEWTIILNSRALPQIDKYTSTYVSTERQWKTSPHFYIVLRCFCDLSRSTPSFTRAGFISMWSDNKKIFFFLYFHRTHKFIYTWKIIAFFLLLLLYSVYICRYLLCKSLFHSTYWLKKCDNESNTFKWIFLSHMNVNHTSFHRHHMDCFMQ